MTIHEKMMKIQTTLKAPKNLRNSFGGYMYRNAEGILEAVKPLLEEQKLAMYITDDVIAVGDRVYVKATVKVQDIETEASVVTTALAREALNKKGMDDSQITGTASSYARKYALNGIFLLDDTKDADTDENQKERKAINECFERLWKQYPNKKGKGQVSDTKKKILYQKGEEHIQRALKRYLEGLEQDSSWRKPQNGSTFFNSGYIDYLDENYEKPPEPKPQRNPASVLSCERDYDFDDLEMQLLHKQLE